MVAAFLIKVFILQVIVVAIIVYILYVLLDKQLVESAVHKLETTNLDSLEPKLLEITVVTPKGILDDKIKGRLSQCLVKKLNRNVDIIVIGDKHMKGGIVIKSRNLLIDNSLSGRLKASGMAR